LIYGEELTEEPPLEAMAAVMDDYNAFTAHLRERGAMIAGEGLQPTATATTVRVMDGRTITTEGRSPRRRSSWAGSISSRRPTLTRRSPTPR
jgi:hypothetical protein